MEAVAETSATSGARPLAIARIVLPLLLGGAIALVPTPAGLPPAAWHYFALFVTVITLIITEPIPAAAIGMAGVTAGAVLGLVRETPAASAQWALSGFGNTIVWLIFAAFMFTVGYAQTGLGRRIALHLVRAAGPPYARARLRRRAGRPGVRAVHAVRDGAKRRHDLSGHQPHSAAVWIATATTVRRG